MLHKLFARKIRILGRSVPLATVALAVVVVGAAAWVSIFLLATRFAVTTSAALVVPTDQGSWECNLISGTGATIVTCADRAGSKGPELVVTGLSEDDLHIQLTRGFYNTNSQPFNLELVGTQNPKVPVCLWDSGISACDADGIRTVGATSVLSVVIDVQSSGIGPGETVDITGLEMRWYP